MVQDHGCIRVFKESLALMKRGHVVDVLARETPFGFNRYNTFGLYHDADQLRRAVAASSADVVHVHNEPDSLVPIVRSATQAPVIFDVHDLESLRWDRAPDAAELAAFDAADAFVHVSDECAKVAARWHGTRKPSVVLPCMINEEFYATEQAGEPAWSTIVYEGGLATAQSLPPDAEGREQVNFRSLEPVVEAFVGQGFEFRLHPSLPQDGYVYENLGAVVFQPLQFPALLRALRSYGYGFVGAPHSVPLMEAAMPNKLFEYLSQGVVPVVLNASRAARFVLEHGLGIVLDGLDNLAAQLARGPEIRERILARRHDWAMDRHIHVVENLYAAVLDRQPVEAVA